MDLQQLRTLIHVAELGSISAAADRLGVAQPALSRRIRLLEGELGVTLFERHGRGVRPVDPCLDILEHADRVMTELDAIRSVAADEHLPLTGRVAVGMPPTAGDLLTVDVASTIRRHHPEATLRIASAYSRHLHDWLQRGELDLAILFDGPPLRSLETIDLVEEPLVLVSGAEHETAPTITFDELAELPLLLPSTGHGLRSRLDDIARRRRLELDIPVETDSFAAIKQLVAAGQGHAVLPPASIVDDVALGRLRATPIVDPVPTRRLVLAVPSDRPATPLARFAATTIRSTVVDMVHTGRWPGGLVAQASTGTV